MLIGTRRVTPDNPYIIAEIGSNWRHFEDCTESIKMAKACGADAVKFQYFTYEKLYGLPAPDSHDRRYELNPAWIYDLSQFAKIQGIDFMCSVFDPKDVMLLDPLVSAHKVASSELCHYELIVALLEATKPIILSTGGAQIHEVQEVKTLLMGGIGTTDIAWLHCIPEYPAIHGDWTRIDRLKDALKTSNVGYSDHTLSLGAPHDVIILEKHVKLGDFQTPDAPHSLMPYDFMTYVRNARNPNKPDFHTKHRRRMVAVKPIKAGETMVPGTNIGAYRSLKSSPRYRSPLYYGFAQHEIAQRDYEPGDSIEP